jgi:hypothetical protein
MVWSSLNAGARRNVEELAAYAEESIEYRHTGLPQLIRQFLVDPLRVPRHGWSSQAELLRDIFGNPFHPSPFLPSNVLRWNDGTIVRLAEVVYEESDMPGGALDNSRLAILADALLDAGCDDEALIQHCRSEGQHVRGCWAIDLILEKE